MQWRFLGDDYEWKTKTKVEILRSHFGYMSQNEMFNVVFILRQIMEKNREMAILDLEKATVRIP